MANRFYANTLDLITSTKARATDVEANFTSVEAGFDALATEYDATLAAKAAKAGDTYTGTHNFTGATLNVATPAAGIANNLAVNMTALLSAIAAVNAVGMLVRLPIDTASATAVVGTVSELTFAGVVTMTMPTTTTDGVMVGFVTANNRNNVIAFGAQILLGPLGEDNGNITLELGILYCRWNQSKGKWVVQ